MKVKVLCMYNECRNNEHYEEFDKEKWTNREPAICKLLEEEDKGILIVGRWVSINLAEEHKWRKLFPVCSMSDTMTKPETEDPN